MPIDTKQTLILLAIFVVVQPGCAGPAPEVPPTPGIGEVIHLRGDVRVSRNARLHGLQIGSDLIEADRLITGRESYAFTDINAARLIDIGAYSDVMFGQMRNRPPDQGMLDISVRRGCLHYLSTGENQVRTVFRTPSSTIVNVGGEFRLVVTESETIIVYQDGQLTVADISETNLYEASTPGEVIEVYRAEPPRRIDSADAIESFHDCMPPKRGQIGVKGTREPD